MRGGLHLSLAGLVAVWLTASGFGPRAWAAAASADDADDPKMSRLFQAAPPVVAPPRANMAAPVSTKPAPPRPAPLPAVTTPSEIAKPAAPKAVPAPPVTVVPVAPARAAVVAAPAPASPVGVASARAIPAAPAAAVVPAEPVAIEASKPAPPPADGDGAKPNAPSVDVAARSERAESPPAGREWSYAPRLKLAYRRFPFVRVAAPPGATTTTPTSQSESFESVSIDFYPMSWFLRVGLSTQFGWESAKFDRSGDYFIAESASVGFQWPGRITPFVEGLAGAGYMRRVGADWNLPTAYWQVGIDAGIEVYLAKRAYVSLAVGYLHPGNLFLRDQSLMSVKSDSWSVKLGFGI